MPVGASTGSGVLRLPGGWGRRSCNNVAIYLLVGSVVARGPSSYISQMRMEGISMESYLFRGGFLKAGNRKARRNVRCRERKLVHKARVSVAVSGDWLPAT